MEENSGEEQNRAIGRTMGPLCCAGFHAVIEGCGAKGFYNDLGVGRLWHPVKTDNFEYV
jgi:hypothetical protein